MPSTDIGIDLGTKNSLVYSTVKGIIFKEPSVVIYDKDTEKIRAIGEEARQMAGHLTSNLELIRPIRQGVIVDYNVMEKMMKHLISKAARHSDYYHNSNRRYFSAFCTVRPRIRLSTTFLTNAESSLPCLFRLQEPYPYSRYRRFPHYFSTYRGQS